MVENRWVTDYREASSRETQSHTSRKDKNIEEERRSKRSRSQSREKRSTRGVDCDSRSRSRDRRRGRIDINQDRNEGERKSPRHGEDRDDSSKKSTYVYVPNSIGKSAGFVEEDGLSKKKKFDVDDRDNSTVIEDFSNEENLNEVQEVGKIALARKKMRDFLLLKYNSEKVFLSSSQHDMFRISPTVDASRVQCALPSKPLTVTSNTSPFPAEFLAAMAIADEISSPRSEEAYEGNNDVFSALAVTAVKAEMKMIKPSRKFHRDTSATHLNKEPSVDLRRDGSPDISGMSHINLAPKSSTFHSQNNNTKISFSSSATGGTDKENQAELDSQRNTLKAPKIPKGLKIITGSELDTEEHSYRSTEHSVDRTKEESYSLSKEICLLTDSLSSTPSCAYASNKALTCESRDDVTVQRSTDPEEESAKTAEQEKCKKGEGVEGTISLDSWDDVEGYYMPTTGEIIGDNYQILDSVGKGVFSTVVKCKNFSSSGGAMVAVKIIRNNEVMRRAAEKEHTILSLIRQADLEGKRNCVQLIGNFEFRNHIALVFEYQAMNLRETLYKFGKDVGINIGAVRMYARQLLSALRHLADLKIVHGDIKLDNILCSEDLKQVTLCDFGSAFLETDKDIKPTPYIVSRFYRAPEIILGLTYDRGIDIWSVAVCLYELFAGHIMFPGGSNNEMLRLMMAIKGPLSENQVLSHCLAFESMGLNPHFDHRNFMFRQIEIDPDTGVSHLRMVKICDPCHDVASVMKGSKTNSENGGLVAGLADLLNSCLTLDPKDRITVFDAYHHSFFSLKG